MDKTVKAVMSTRIHACLPDTPVPQVARQMTENKVSAIIVVDQEGFLVGIISQTDLVILRAYDELWRELKAEHVMIKQVITIDPDATIQKAANELIAHKIHRLVVVDHLEGRQKPVGVLSMTDIVRDMAFG